MVLAVELELLAVRRHPASRRRGPLERLRDLVVKSVNVVLRHSDRGDADLDLAYDAAVVRAGQVHHHPRLIPAQEVAHLGEEAPPLPVVIHERGTDGLLSTGRANPDPRPSPRGRHRRPGGARRSARTARSASRQTTSGGLPRKWSAPRHSRRLSSPNVARRRRRNACPCSSCGGGTKTPTSIRRNVAPAFSGSPTPAHLEPCLAVLLPEPHESVEPHRRAAGLPSRGESPLDRCALLGLNAEPLERARERGGVLRLDRHRQPMPDRCLVFVRRHSTLRHCQRSRRIGREPPRGVSED